MNYDYEPSKDNSSSLVSKDIYIPPYKDCDIDIKMIPADCIYIPPSTQEKRSKTFENSVEANGFKWPWFGVLGVTYTPNILNFRGEPMYAVNVGGNRWLFMDKYDRTIELPCSVSYDESTAAQASLSLHTDGRKGKRGTRTESEHKLAIQAKIPLDVALDNILNDYDMRAFQLPLEHKITGQANGAIDPQYDAYRQKNKPRMLTGCPAAMKNILSKHKEQITRATVETILQTYKKKSAAFKANVLKAIADIYGDAKRDGKIVDRNRLVTALATHNSPAGWEEDGRKTKGPWGVTIVIAIKECIVIEYNKRLQLKSKQLRRLLPS